ncbi:MAG TPA: ferredoxin--NADP reductase [Flavobacterium sp.]|jgi:ring-1,2-phenylacetyl-CoA epoxidase subunit PaaE|uniref:ferredoxin--NADP reductase n=1 Tax=Flavobacterium sp. TaxID=239 RepID=UPI001B42EC44|nr:ferredoxin--NADP reductase [Flavobacterium sp.]MBP7181739.1 ferredoxin--NADP reductase [Flavobacterium sp.]MBP8887553.1 ferredoxin--NADP reductase [Flavobacterium sp.]HRL72483.1 ferredoxin--NADP reductase [Flavobacterium sp.]HRM12391.1 ferredoxin--NADP reductase [Flavobacterium sp.]HRM45607.1 ferredoxin--NADP reductase [Flavobacterium sp.]
MSSFLKLIIKEVKRETKDAVSILFNVPEELKADYTFVAGQYINLKLTLDGTEIRRAYSICSSPESGELRIAVKAVKDGAFSQFANTKLKAGDAIEVGKPEGKFTFEPQADRQKNYAAFAAGSGITPIMSILKSVLKNEPKSSFVLVYGNKTPEETIFHQELHDLQLQYVGRLFVHYVFSQAKVENALFGRIEKSSVNFVLNNKHKELAFDKYYLCGPEEMITIVSGVLKEHNVKETAIKFELFTTSCKENKIEQSLEGHTTITIMVDDEETTFEMSQKQTVLDAALKKGIDAPYSCQGGICSSCLARVTSGTAEMTKNSILTDKEIASGLILTCQAHPTSERIYIDYDDV